VKEYTEYDSAGYPHKVREYDQPLPVCETTMTPRLPRELCGNCGTYPDNLGPCASFEEGANGRCVYCDHALACHPIDVCPI
jgi:hypothetical protein